MNTTLIILGSHPRTRGEFDFDRTDCDIWAFNEAVSRKADPWAKRADAIFQMHVPPIWRNPANRNDPNHYNWLKTQRECVVYMQDEYPEVPMSKKYPLQGVLDMLNGDPDHFLVSSIPEAMALAAYLGIYKRIEIYGVAMETNTEWQFQREGVAFWKGFLMGRGIDVHFADATYRSPIYGYEGEVSIKYERFDERIQEINPEIDKISGLYMAALENTKHVIAEFEVACSAENEKKLYETVAKQVDVGQKLGLLDGARQENMRYKGKADKMRAASEGEFIFSRQEFESSAKQLTDKTNAANISFISLGTTLEIMQRNVKNAAKDSPKFNHFMEQFRQMLQAYLQASNQMAILKGAAQENIRYMAYLDQHIRAAGGAKAETVLLNQVQNV